MCGFLSQHLAFLLAFLIIHACTTRHNSFLLVECTQGGGGFLYHQPLAGCRFCWCKTSCIVFAETAKKGIWNLVYSMHLRWVQYSIAECVGSSVRVVSFLRIVQYFDFGCECFVTDEQSITSIDEVLLAMLNKKKFIIKQILGVSERNKHEN